MEGLMRACEPLLCVPLLLLSLACHGDKATAPRTSIELASIALVSGDGQTGLAGAALPAPLVVEARDRLGHPKPGVEITFAATRGGTLGAQSVTTNADGRASTPWMLGTQHIHQQATARAAGLDKVLTATASVDTTRALYVSVRDTVEAGDTVTVNVRINLAGAGNARRGMVVGTLGWPTSQLTFQSLITREGDLSSSKYTSGANGALTVATGAPANVFTGDEIAFAAHFLVPASASGQDIQLSLTPRGVVAAGTLADLLGQISAVGTSTHVR
jgi:hypothetical protein